MKQQTATTQVFIVLALGSFLAQSKSVVLPLVLGSVVKAVGVPQSQAGWIAGFELGAVTVAILATFIWIDRWGPRLFALTGAAALAIGSVSSALAPFLTAMIAARVVVGLGEGALFSAVFAAAGRFAPPERTYAVMQGGAMVIAVALSLGLPRVITWLAYPGAFLLMALFAGVMLPLCRKLPQDSVAAGNHHFMLTRPALVVLVALALVSIGIHGVWYTAGIHGAAIGLSPQLIGAGVLWGLIVGAVGALIISDVAKRFGNGWFLWMGSALCIVAIVTGGMQSQLTFYLSMGLIPLGFALVLAYHSGLLARIDASGRAAALAPVCWTGGAALGPSLISLTLDEYGYALFAGLSTIAVIVSILLTLRRGEVIR